MFIDRCFVAQSVQDGNGTGGGFFDDSTTRATGTGSPRRDDGALASSSASAAMAPAPAATAGEYVVRDLRRDDFPAYVFDAVRVRPSARPPARPRPSVQPFPRHSLNLSVCPPSPARGPAPCLPCPLLSFPRCEASRVTRGRCAKSYKFDKPAS